MKRTLSIAIILSMLVFGTELRQFLRLPQLFGHFLEHRAEDPDMSLTAFLWMHYFMDQVQDADFHKDERLPFRSPEALPQLNIVVDQLPASGGVRSIPTELEAQLLPVSDHGLLAGSRASVWQPPRA